MCDYTLRENRSECIDQKMKYINNKTKLGNHKVDK